MGIRHLSWDHGESRSGHLFLGNPGRKVRPGVDFRRGDAGSRAYFIPTRRSVTQTPPASHLCRLDGLLLRFTGECGRPNGPSSHRALSSQSQASRKHRGVRFSNLALATFLCLVGLPKGPPDRGSPKIPKKSTPIRSSRAHETRSWLFSRPFRRPLLLLRVHGPGMPRPDPLRKPSSPV